MPDFQLLPVPGDPFHGQEPGADPEMQQENQRLGQSEGVLYTPPQSVPEGYIMQQVPGVEGSSAWHIYSPQGLFVGRGATPADAINFAGNYSAPFRRAQAPQPESGPEMQTGGQQASPLPEGYIRDENYSPSYRRAGSQQAPLSDAAINAALRTNPGASIFDIADPGHQTPETPPPYRYNTDIGQNLYNQHIAPHYGDQENFLKEFFAGMASPNPMETKIEGDTRGAMTFVTVLKDENGDVIGLMRRSFDPNTGEVHHDLFSLSGDTQGSDVGKKLLGAQVAAYQKMGNVKEVTLSANIDVGGYAWAKYGFYPTEQEWGEVARNAGTRLQNLVSSGSISQEAAAPVFKTLADPNPRAIWDIADLKQPVTGSPAYRSYKSSGESSPMPLGKALLLRQAWSGRLPLNDTQAMGRFNAYIQSKTGSGNVQPGQPGQSQ